MRSSIASDAGSRAASDARPNTSSRAALDDRGQATVELALCLPFLCLLLLGTVQVGLVVRDQLAVGLAAREAARAAAVSADPVGAGTAAALESGLDAQRAVIDIGDDGTDVVAAITSRVPTDLPLIGALLPDLAVHASATMAVEPP